MQTKLSHEQFNFYFRKLAEIYRQYQEYQFSDVYYEGTEYEYVDVRNRLDSEENERSHEAFLLALLNLGCRGFLIGYDDNEVSVVNPFLIEVAQNKVNVIAEIVLENKYHSALYNGIVIDQYKVPTDQFPQYEEFYPQSYTGQVYLADALGRKFPQLTYSEANQLAGYVRSLAVDKFYYKF